MKLPYPSMLQTRGPPKNVCCESVQTETMQSGDPLYVVFLDPFTENPKAVQALELGYKLIDVNTYIITYLSADFICKSKEVQISPQNLVPSGNHNEYHFLEQILE